MQTNIHRWQTLRAKLKAQMISCQSDTRLLVLLNRLNIVNRHNRATNIANGMPGKPYVDATLADLKRLKHERLNPNQGPQGPHKRGV